MDTAGERQLGQYVFSTGDAAAERLRLLHSVFGATTDLLLRDAGIAKGMRVADVGCGVGIVSRELAGLVGERGSVVGIDVSPDQLAIAKHAACEFGLSNVEFVEASAIELPYDAGEFDFVYCRLVLTHVAHPESAIGEFHRVLRPGGMVACEELIGPQAYSSPPSAVYARLSAMVSEFGKGRGIDYAIGARLPHLVKAAGFDAPRARFVQPAYFCGEQKCWWEYSVREAGAALLKSGFLSKDDLTSLLNALAAISTDESILVAQPPLAQVWAARC